jgi:hypothetical protein
MGLSQNSELRLSLTPGFSPVIKDGIITRTVSTVSHCGKDKAFVLNQSPPFDKRLNR